MTIIDPLRTLPKAELHLHIEGTLEPELAYALARRNGVSLPCSDATELRAQYDFADLQSFLDLYYSCMTVLVTERDFEELTVAYLERAVADGVRHVELFFDPQVHEANGVAVDTVIDGLLAGLAVGATRWGVSGGLILCFLRDHSVESAHRLLDSVAHRFEDVLGVGLDSAEVGYPPAMFESVFARAAEAGLHRVAHAGEEGPPAYVREALDLLGVERIDHGIRAAEDPELLAILAERGIPLTVCPLSNVRLQAVASLDAHPMRLLFDAGVHVTVNSDDPAYFGGYIGDNFVAMASIGFTLAELTTMARNSVVASFASADRKSVLLTSIDDWTASRED